MATRARRIVRFSSQSPGRLSFYSAYCSGALSAPGTHRRPKWELRARHDKALFHWAKARAADRVVLIAGHTHRPVFWDRVPPVPDQTKIVELEEKQAAERASGAPNEQRAATNATLEFTRGERLWQPDPPEPMRPPCYLNTGCCAFGDGDATGLEIVNGDIRLVRWPDNDGNAQPEVLANASLSSVFAAFDRSDDSGCRLVPDSILIASITHDSVANEEVETPV